nr:unnamed protein product [Spirometra erinaceieuropaei]
MARKSARYKVDIAALNETRFSKQGQLEEVGAGNTFFWRAVYGPPTKRTAPLLSADGSTLLVEKKQILRRWAEHFQGVLNRPSTISDATIAPLPQVDTNVDLNLPPSLRETIRAVRQPSSGKTLGSDAIPPEVYKHGGLQLTDHLTAVFQGM